jgi:hypothetical protein
MAARASELIDIVARKALYIPVNTPEGIKRLEKSMKSELRRRVIEDDISIMKGVNLSDIKSASEDDDVFEYEDLFVEAMPKVDARRLQISRVNGALTKSMDERGIIFDAHKGKKISGRYEMPLTKYDKDCDRVCYLVYRVKKGVLHYPSLGSYRSPLVSFNCYVNSEFGNEVTKIVHDTIQKMTSKK